MNFRPKSSNSHLKIILGFSLVAVSKYLSSSKTNCTQWQSFEIGFDSTIPIWFTPVYLLSSSDFWAISSVLKSLRHQVIIIIALVLPSYLCQTTDCAAQWWDNVLDLLLLRYIVQSDVNHITSFPTNIHRKCLTPYQSGTIWIISQKTKQWQSCEKSIEILQEYVGELPTHCMAIPHSTYPVQP